MSLTELDLLARKHRLMTWHWIQITAVSGTKRQKRSLDGILLSVNESDFLSIQWPQVSCRTWSEATVDLLWVSCHGTLVRRLGDEERRLMHLVPAAAVKPMKRRVLSRPGVDSVLLALAGILLALKCWQSSFHYLISVGLEVYRVLAIQSLGSTVSLFTLPTFPLLLRRAWDVTARQKKASQISCDCLSGLTVGYHCQSGGWRSIEFTGMKSCSFLYSFSNYISY